MKLNLYGIDGKATANEIELNDAVFGVEPNDHAIWLDVKLIMANRRQGTHESKGRSYVSGGGKKPFRQKGTGRARQGTIRAPHHVGGGRVFGPHVRTYSMKVNHKVKTLARKSALAYKVKDNKFIVIEDFNYEKPSVKNIKNILGAFNLTEKNVLICTGQYSSAIVQSSNNLFRVQVRDSVSFSTYDLLKADTILMQESALKKVNEVLGK
jgi:large subunit ribosomal protein L4